MNDLSCDRVRGLLPWFVGSDLDAADTVAVRQHLIGCLACRNEAAGLQRAIASLREESGRKVEGVDEAMFTSLQQAIVDRIGTVAAAECALPAVGTLARRWAWVGAAALLVGIGFWWGLGRARDSVWSRAPMTTPAAFEEPKAVPYSGPRAPLRLLGNDGPDDAEPAGNDGTGLRGRDQLRVLVDERMVLPPPRKPPR